MPKATRDPVIDQWLSDEFGDKGNNIQAVDQLSALTMASSRPNASQLPGPVLNAWRLALVRARRTVDQAEDAFIEYSIKNGMSWQQVAEELGHSTPEAAQRHHQHLKSELERTHPSANEQIYRP